MTWGQDLSLVLSQCQTTLTYVDDDETAQLRRPKLLAFGRKIKNALYDVWKEAPTDVFDNAYGFCCLFIDEFSGIIAERRTRSRELTSSLNNSGQLNVFEMRSIRF